VNNAVKRAIRTFFQTFLGTIISSGILSAASTSGVVDWSGLEKLAVSALSAGLVAVLSFTQNALEDSGTIPPVLKGS